MNIENSVVMQSPPIVVVDQGGNKRRRIEFDQLFTFPMIPPLMVCASDTIMVWPLFPPQSLDPLVRNSILVVFEGNGCSVGKRTKPC